MDIRDRAIRQGASSRREKFGPVEVIEWGPDEKTPALVYGFRPTLREYGQVTAATTEGDAESLAVSLSVLGRDAEGAQLFPSPEEILDYYDPGVVSRVVNEIMGLMGYSEIEPKK